MVTPSQVETVKKIMPWFYDVLVGSQPQSIECVSKHGLQDTTSPTGKDGWWDYLNQSLIVELGNVLLVEMMGTVTPENLYGHRHFRIHLAGPGRLLTFWERGHLLPFKHLLSEYLATPEQGRYPVEDWVVPLLVWCEAGYYQLYTGVRGTEVEKPERLVRLHPNGTVEHFEASEGISLPNFVGSALPLSRLLTEVFDITATMDAVHAARLVTQYPADWVWSGYKPWMNPPTNLRRAAEVAEASPTCVN